MHDQNLYQVLYGLTRATGERKYADEADKALSYFLTNCQSSVTGLLPWGEHLCWGFENDDRSGWIHEFFRPWKLWDRCYALDKPACVRFARGLWDHQIGDKKTGGFSRHAAYQRHGPATGMDFPCHGGYYIATWAEAYGRTK